MANKKLKQWIQETLKDPEWGSHQEVKLFNTRKKADWAYFYPNGSAILIEDKEENDSDLTAAKAQLEEYEKICNDNGYKDIMKIAVKDKGTDICVQIYRNNEFYSSILETLKAYETTLKAREINDIKDDIYKYTSKINQSLHDNLKIKHLTDRMVFTGVILVASKYSNGIFEKYAGIQGFKQSIANKITSQLSASEIKSSKINSLVKRFLSIQIGTKPSNAVIDALCGWCKNINDIISENPKSNIDIMNIFFTEFNRYRGKSEHGQVFTPDHIADLMSKLLKIKKEDKILDPTCGSGSLIVKCANRNDNSWDNMYGNDFDLNILYLAYINMLLHNDGITNLTNLDALSPDFSKKIKNYKITKVIANPPYENQNAIEILKNVLNNVEDGCRLCWLMPNTKMEKIKSSRYILKNNTLTDIILLPDIFAKVGCGDVSLFMFTKGTPQGNQKIKCWWIPDDGFETVKNEGYQDVKHKWPKIEQEFLEKWDNNQFDKEIDPNVCLSYPKEHENQKITKEDFEITLLQWLIFKNNGRIEKQNAVQSVFKSIIDFVKINNLEDKIDFLKKLSREKSKNEKDI